MIKASLILITLFGVLQSNGQEYEIKTTPVISDSMATGYYLEDLPKVGNITCGTGKLLSGFQLVDMNGANDNSFYFKIFCSPEPRTLSWPGFFHHNIQTNTGSGFLDLRTNSISCGGHQVINSFVWPSLSARKYIGDCVLVDHVASTLFETRIVTTSLGYQGMAAVPVICPTYSPYLKSVQMNLYSGVGFSFSYVCTEANMAPTSSPTTLPTMSPSRTPTVKPSYSPTTSPSSSPTVKPSYSPTTSPSNTPTVKPSYSPTNSPTLSLASCLSETLIEELKQVVETYVEQNINRVVDDCVEG